MAMEKQYRDSPVGMHHDHPEPEPEQHDRDARDPWKHRESGMRCKTCMWYVPKPPHHGATVLGRCRRRCPCMGGYPVVFQTDWCGDHKLDEDKI